MWPFRRRRPPPGPSPVTVAEDEDDFEGGDGPDSPDDLTNRIVRLHGLLDEALSNEVIQREVLAVLLANGVSIYSVDDFDVRQRHKELRVTVWIRLCHAT